ncbi:MAG TPA: PQQ-dependent sugar dehydrogenase [Terrimesophilobacter sp.]|nr:PQQ-dependent sugar dehydrogenase [Terrimesophilobacter sp.]
MRRPVLSVVAGMLALAVAGCAAEVPREPSAVPAPSPSARPTQTPFAGPVMPAGSPTALISGLSAPWSVVRLPTGSALISERDTGKILEYTAAGAVRVVTTVEGVAHGGEGGLLGLAVLDTGTPDYLYAYYTTANDNRIVRMPLLGSPGDYRLGTQQAILTGLARAGNHNGGRIAFGPDGTLYATVGDAGQPSRSQDLSSPNGKILRMNPDGSVPSDNPFPGSLVYSYGHRNPQGLAWDLNGQLWASEFGQNTWDEFNRIEAGKNYGWPVVEGIGGKPGYVDPVLQWATSEASPSGLAYVSGTFFLASLRGQRLWAINTAGTPHSTAWFAGEFGRLRDAVPGPNGTLWVLTNNTDGRGSPRSGDDKLLQITLVPGT